MITYTGCVILAETFMPAATHALYDGNPRANRAEVVKSFERKPSGAAARWDVAARHSFGRRKRSPVRARSAACWYATPATATAWSRPTVTVDDRLAAVADHVTFDAANGTLSRAAGPNGTR